MNANPVRIGHILMSRATHHDHGNGWVYSRDLGGIKHIRYSGDWKGWDALHRRIWRAFNPLRLLGLDRMSRFWTSRRDYTPKNLALMAIANIRVHMATDRHLPDGKVGPVITHWEEDGEYIEMVGPTVGEKIAAFLTEDPANPHAVAIAEEIARVWSLSGTYIADHDDGKEED